MKRISAFLLLMFLASCSIFKSGSQREEIEYPGYLNMTAAEEWGSEEITEEQKTHEITKITIHHGGTEFTHDKNVAEYLRNLQSWSRSEKGWIDIPYHYLIDLDGNMYEGRPLNIPGDTNTDYNPEGHALICVLGNYEVQQVSANQLEAVASLSAWLSDRYDIPVKDIKSHKDYTETLCPGKNLYVYLKNGKLYEMISAKIIKGQ